MNQHTATSNQLTAATDPKWTKSQPAGFSVFIICIFISQIRLVLPGASATLEEGRHGLAQPRIRHSCHLLRGCNCFFFSSCFLVLQTRFSLSRSRQIPSALSANCWTTIWRFTTLETRQVQQNTDSGKRWIRESINFTVSAEKMYSELSFYSSTVVCRAIWKAVSTAPRHWNLNGRFEKRRENHSSGIPRSFPSFKGSLERWIDFS